MLFNVFVQVEQLGERERKRDPPPSSTNTTPVSAGVGEGVAREVSDRRSRPPKKAKEEKEVKRWRTDSHS